MSQLIAWIVVLLILVFIYKIGSFLWRTLGILLLLFLIWVYREEIMTQLNQWTQNFRWGGPIDDRQSSLAMDQGRLPITAKLGD